MKYFGTYISMQEKAIKAKDAHTEPYTHNARAIENSRSLVSLSFITSAVPSSAPGTDSEVQASVCEQLYSC